LPSPKKIHNDAKTPTPKWHSNCEIMSLRNPWECPQLRMNTKIRQGVQSRTNRTTNTKKMIASAELVFFAFPQVLLFNRYNSLQVFQNAQVLIALHAETPRGVLVKRAVGTHRLTRSSDHVSDENSDLSSPQSARSDCYQLLRRLCQLLRLLRRL
jgi:hypothetical protein